MLKKFNSREAIRRVASAWKAQYYNKGQWVNLFSGSSHAIYEKLAGLNVSKATSKDVDKIIGTEGWASAWCSNCKEYATSAVEIDDGDSSIYLCRACVKKASALALL